MKKSSLVSIVFASLLLSPVVLARHVQAEEVATNGVEPALTTQVGQPSAAEATPIQMQFQQVGSCLLRRSLRST